MNAPQPFSPRTVAKRRIAATLPACLAMVASAVATAAPNCSQLVEQGCACGLAKPATPATPIGQLSEILGDVLVSGPDGFAPTAPTVPISLGDSVIVATGAHALFASTDGSCQRLLPAESNLVIRDLGDCACASQVSADVDVETTTGQIGAGTAAGAALLTGMGFTTYTVLKALNNDDSGNPVSP